MLDLTSTIPPGRDAHDPRREPARRGAVRASARRAAVLTIVAVALLAGAGCGGDEESGTSGTETTAAATSGSTQESTASSEPDGPAATWPAPDAAKADGCDYVRAGAPGGLTSSVPAELVSEVQAYETALFNDVPGDVPPVSDALSQWVTEACQGYDQQARIDEGTPEAPVFTYESHEGSGPPSVTVRYRGTCPDGDAPTDVTATGPDQAEVPVTDLGDGIVEVTVAIGEPNEPLTDRVAIEAWAPSGPSPSRPGFPLEGTC